MHPSEKGLKGIFPVVPVLRGPVDRECRLVQANRRAVAQFDFGIGEVGVGKNAVGILGSVRDESGVGNDLFLSL